MLSPFRCWNSVALNTKLRWSECFRAAFPSTRITILDQQSHRLNGPIFCVKISLAFDSSILCKFCDKNIFYKTGIHIFGDQIGYSRCEECKWTIRYFPIFQEYFGPIRIRSIVTQLGCRRWKLYFWLSISCIILGRLFICRIIRTKSHSNIMWNSNNATNGAAVETQPASWMSTVHPLQSH